MDSPAAPAAGGRLLLKHFKIPVCHSKSAIDPAPQDVINTTRWNNIREAVQR
jgi:hypothetical protein